jgi:hypothetical protein
MECQEEVMSIERKKRAVAVHSSTPQKLLKNK